MEGTDKNFLLDDPFPEEYFVVIFFLCGIELVVSKKGVSP